MTLTKEKIVSRQKKVRLLCDAYKGKDRFAPKKYVYYVTLTKEKIVSRQKKVRLLCDAYKGKDRFAPKKVRLLCDASEL